MNKPFSPSALKIAARRCAIYTRKSTEEGLEQEFNSLDAQREACAAYVLSQMHEGWSLLPEIYDDGGYSGGNMDRPALQQLLADTRAGKVDVIVVYKVDRLTRSLADFAKIVEVLDASDASFVSVTQTFNTTNSMGRLTLNVLLSFAQFEREVTSERIRDKFAASKRKGMWMGGNVPLGYDVKDRKLVVNEAEAVHVRTIFARYLQIGSTRALLADLAKRGIMSKRRLAKVNLDGAPEKPHYFSVGSITHLLKNRIYIGEVHHRGDYFPGEHEGIVDPKIWKKTQALLEKNRNNHRRGERAEHPSLFAGMMFDSESRPMWPSHTCKGSRRYRYYITRLGVDGKVPADAWRIPAGDIEALVINRLTSFLADAAEIAGQCEGQKHVDPIVAKAAELADALPGLSPPDCRQLFLDLEIKVRVEEERVSIIFGRSQLMAQLGGATVGDSVIAISVEARFVRRGQELKLKYAPKEYGAPSNYDVKLAELIAKAELAYAALTESGSEIPAASRPHLVRLARLKFIAPDIVESIMEGKQPPELTARSLMRGKPLPLCWNEQRAQFGFA